MFESRIASPAVIPAVLVNSLTSTFGALPVATLTLADSAVYSPSAAEAINSSRTAATFGCVGNRVYTGAKDDEAYFAIPGAQLSAMEKALEVIAHANAELEKFHRARASATSAS